ncbi:pyridoxal phosphate-dependent transferase [Apiosordaria backusii]|uniref:Pyridoxal phosphate-dependent transferase n=1 Tax=Apiosordaria backusii TaxID=314023 RepID=A0AA40BMC9_9PEZI|nr:pyridoxal phosphate-dependent transferase [Apiosordaria backusii]
MGQLLSTSSSRHSLHLLPPSTAPTPHGKTEADILLSDSSSELLSPFPREKNSNDDNKTNQDTLPLPLLKTAKGHYYHPVSGPKILDACGGAGVACLGHGTSNKSVIKAINKQLRTFQYASYAHFRVDPVLELEKFLCESTGGKMGRMYLMCSGSEATEAALKFALEYHAWNSQPQRTNIITRSHSYHGTTLGSLSASGHFSRRAPFSSILNTSQFHHLPQEYLTQQISHLDSLFHSLNPSTVAAVILEPIVGAALACVPPVPGYLSAVKSLCRQHGALLIYDEVMCGMGRSSSSSSLHPPNNPPPLHAWQSFPEHTPTNDLSPDLQTIAKGFCAGYLPASALLVSTPITSFMTSHNKVFTHGHTYQSHPVVAAAALAVQRQIQSKHLLSNVQKQGKLLMSLLQEKLGQHPNVGDIRGRGLFIGIEFVKDKKSKEPFNREMDIAGRVHRCAAHHWQVLVYASQGCADDTGRGDAIMIMPAYDVTSNEVKDIGQPQIIET